MLKLHRDKSQTFECKIKIEGAKLDNATTRLVLSGTQMDYIFKGKVDSMGNCFVEIPPLKKLENVEGTATLEVMVDGGYFKPLQTEYKLVSREVSVTEVKVNDSDYKVKVHAEVKKDDSKKSINEKETSSKNPIKENTIFLSNAKSEDIKLVKYVIEGFKKLDKKNKAVLKEFIEFQYKPSKKTLHWATNVFKNPNSIYSKMIMYKIDNK